jgi:hypothetical protein
MSTRVGQRLTTTSDEVLITPMRTPRNATTPATSPIRLAAPLDGRRIRAAVIGTGAIARGSHVPALARLAADGPEPLAAFHQAAAVLVRPRLAEWRERWRRGAEAAAVAAGQQLDRLERGDTSHLGDALVRAEQPSAHGRFGMCGRLDVYDR